MRVNLKIALAGAVAAGAISAVCGISNHVSGSQRDHNVTALERKIALLTNECLTKSGAAAAPQSTMDWSAIKDPVVGKAPQIAAAPLYVCDAKVLAELTKIQVPVEAGAGGSANVQTELGEAQRALDTERNHDPMLWPYALSAFIILITSVLPWLWYFLLQRIRELSTAIRGG